MSLVFASLIGIAVGWNLLLLFQKLERERLRALWFATLRQVQKEGPLLAWNRPFLPMFSFLFKKSVFEREGRRWAKPLQHAGVGKSLSPPEFFAWGFCLACEGLLSALLLFGPSPFAAVCGFIFGGGYPFLWIHLRKEERRREIRKDLPLVMDLLSLSVGAGLDMMQALQKITGLLPPSPLLEEFGEVLGDLKLGLTRKEALERFKEKNPLPEIRQFVALLLQAIQLGSPLAPVLLSGAEQMRSARFIRAERMGVQAGQKILFPLVFCILPAVFLTIFAPLGIRFLTHGFEGFL